MGGRWGSVPAPLRVQDAVLQEEIAYADLCETKQVQKGNIYLDFSATKPMHAVRGDELVFVGRFGSFVPVTEQSGGAILYRIMDEKRHAVTGTKGRFWLLADVAKDLIEEGTVEIDSTYFDDLVLEAQKTISKFGDFAEFVK